MTSTLAFTLKNSFDFVEQLKLQDPSTYMTSFDITSLFTNIPLKECTDIILNSLFSDSTSFHNYTRDLFKPLLQLATQNSFFLFNSVTYEQVDGVAMGSPLGPTLANIFMCHLENIFIQNCPSEFRPVFYKRYVDDTFVLFKHPNHATQFLNYINHMHPNISFTSEHENNSKISFLDILITKTSTGFSTSIYRKPTFSGLSTNFFSSVPLNFKLNAIKTLIHRAFHLCSNWSHIHNEFSFLQQYFSNNSFPNHLFPKILKKFLDCIYHPKTTTFNVPKLKLHSSFPYLGPQLTPTIQKELTTVVSSFFPFIQFLPIFTNPKTIGSLFKFKDTLPPVMRSNIIYQYKCPCCLQGSYVGMTQRRLNERIAAHKGVSYRTGHPLSNKEPSPPRSHAISCNTPLNTKDFTILASVQNKSQLPILESLFIKHTLPSLNSNLKSTPLLIV